MVAEAKRKEAEERKVPLLEGCKTATSGGYQIDYVACNQQSTLKTEVEECKKQAEEPHLAAETAVEVQKKQAAGAGIVNGQVGMLLVAGILLHWLF